MKKYRKKLTTINLCIEQGNFLAWKDMNWQLNGNVTEEEEREETVCGNNYNIQLPLLWTFSEARNKCSKMGHGKISSLPDPSNVSKVEDYFGEGLNSCREIWTPYSGTSYYKTLLKKILTFWIVDRTREGIYQDVYTHNTVDNLDWFWNNPNGGKIADNVILQKNGKRSYLFDRPIDDNACVFCSIPKTTVFYLRGMCRDSYLKHEYIAVMNDETLKYYSLDGQFSIR